MNAPTNQPAVSGCDPATVDAAIDSIERDALTDLSGVLARAPEIVAQADVAGLPVLRVRARRAWGQVLAYANRYEDALAVFALAEELGRTAEPVQAALACNTSVHALCRLGRFDDAVVAGTRARHTFLAHGRIDLAARADVNTAVAHRMADRPQQAIGLFERALPAFDGQPVVLAQVESNRAEAMLDVGRFDEAERAFRAALVAFERGGAPRAAAIGRGNLADLAGRQGRLHDAVEGFELARRSLDDAGAPGDAARLEVEQAEALVTLGMHGAAVAAFEHALPTLTSAGLVAEAARAHLGLGRALARLGRIASGAGELRLAERAFEAMSHTTGVARARLLLAEVTLASGDPLAAREGLDRALADLADRPGDVCGAMVLRSVVRRQLGELAGAELDARGARAEAERLGLPHHAADATMVLAAAQRSAGQAAEALATLREGMTLVEQLRGTLHAGRYRAAFLGDRGRVFVDAADVALEIAQSHNAPRDLVEEAFESIERSRARSLLDAMVAGTPDGGVARAMAAGNEEGLAARLMKERGTLNGLYDRLDQTGLHMPPERLAEWRAQIGASEHTIDELERRLLSGGNGVGMFASSATVAGVLPSVPAGRALISYFIAQGGLGAFVVQRGRSIEAVRGIAPMAEVERAIGELGFQVSRAIARGIPGGEAGVRSTRDVQSAMDRVGTLTLAPLLARLEGPTGLIVAPVGLLFGVPFAALASSALGTVPITVVPSASVLAHLFARESTSAEARSGALFVGISDDAAPHAEAECAAIAARVAGARTLLGASATRGAFIEACSAAATIHLATHARFISTEPNASGIRLADGWLTTRDLADTNLRGARVILSACDTGRVGRGAGEEVLGLARSLVLAGARSMVMSLWPLHDRSARILMDELYESWHSDGADRSLACALARAQQGLRAVEANPAAWAPYVCFGLE
ncbi:MAG: CHAT domain-containing protein [Phycisphaerales bacterium]